jgi:hypothetical protein
MEGMPGVTAVVVDEAKDLIGDSVEEEVGNDYRVMRLVEMSVLVTRYDGIRSSGRTGNTVKEEETYQRRR